MVWWGEGEGEGEGMYRQVLAGRKVRKARSSVCNGVRTFCGGVGCSN